MCIEVCVCLGCVHVDTVAHRVQERMVEPLELELVCHKPSNMGSRSQTQVLYKGNTCSETLSALPL